MASTPKQPRKSSRSAPIDAPPKAGLFARIRRGAIKGVVAVAGVFAALILLFSFAPPLINIYQVQEAWRQGGISKDWTGWDDIAPEMARAIVAAEDANFCNHWGFDVAAIRDAVSEGSMRGASTLTQQTVKNVFLWHGRSYIRKALEAVLTPAVEFVWSKQRILEVYMNIAEFGTGIFGVQAAAQHFFGVDAADLTATQAARLAAVLPDPKGRDPNGKSGFMRRRTASILSGAQTIAADGRARCFQY
ncbi:MAG: monofunctional biosynthetic peptidoglycan transglycosylase [Cypionkella sp.]|nr:monofunctional biosynthetic peptidoglycan transglycosylase [Cypionkella sp.]